MSKSSLVAPKVRNALNDARFFFTRKGKKTIFVEGEKDYKMLHPLVKDDVRLEVLDGKPNVLFVESKYLTDKFAIQNKYVMMMADVDYDIVLGKILKHSIDYNVFCKSNGFFYNDLEIFLVNTKALKKLLTNNNVYLSSEELEDFKNSIESASRFFGKYRAADEYLKHTMGGYSVLNSFSMDDYIIINDMTIDVNTNAFLEQLPLWANRTELVEDLSSEAERLNRKHAGLWELSNGHDVTKMITLYIEAKETRRLSRKVNIRHNDIELLLRAACDSNDYTMTPMGTALGQFGAI